MTFEEFFKKKKIDLDAFEKGNPALLFEFKDHFEKMGEKSFDHTKKYWFNKLRLQYHLAPEVKADKLRMENPLAEQTITDSLVESTIPEQKSAAPKPGFTPRFKGGIATPTEQPGAESPAENAPIEPAAEKPKGFTPRFKAGVTKPAEETNLAAEENKPAEPVAEKPKGFTPRFKAGVTKATDTLPQQAAQKTGPVGEEDNVEKAPSVDKPRVGFTPRFKAGVTKTAETPAAAPEENKTEETPVQDKPKPGFTPRFKAGITKPAEQAEPAKEEDKTEEAPADNKPKIGFTPRFKASSPPKQQDPPAGDQ